MAETGRTESDDLTLSVWSNLALHTRLLSRISQREAIKELRQAREPLSALPIVVVSVIHAGDTGLNMTKYRLRDIMWAPKCGKHSSGGSPQIVRRPVRNR